MSEDIRDPFAVEDEYDPFATADEANKRGGPFIPWPKMPDITGRLVVLVPRKFEKEAKVGARAQAEYGMSATQEQWTTDLVVLDGGQLSYACKIKDGDEYKDATHVIDTLPALITNWPVSSGNIIGVLNRISDGPKPFALGRILPGYPKKQMDAGKTFGDWAAESEAFYANPRGKTQPKAVWHLVVSDDAADRALGLAWFKAATAEGFKI